MSEICFQTLQLGEEECEVRGETSLFHVDAGDDSWGRVNYTAHFGRCVISSIIKTKKQKKKKKEEARILRVASLLQSSSQCPVNSACFGKVRV
jgi:hypothetical protein